MSIFSDIILTLKEYTNQEAKELRNNLDKAIRRINQLEQIQVILVKKLVSKELVIENLLEQINKE